MGEPTHNLTACDRCHIYHCSVCGCPSSKSRYPNYPNTREGRAGFVRHRLSEQDRAEIEAVAHAIVSAAIPTVVTA